MHRIITNGKDLCDVDETNKINGTPIAAYLNPQKIEGTRTQVVPKNYASPHGHAINEAPMADPNLAPQKNDETDHTDKQTRCLKIRTLGGGNEELELLVLTNLRTISVDTE